MKKKKRIKVLEAQVKQLRSEVAELQVRMPYYHTAPTYTFPCREPNQTGDFPIPPVVTWTTTDIDIKSLPYSCTIN